MKLLLHHQDTLQSGDQIFEDKTSLQGLTNQTEHGQYVEDVSTPQLTSQHVPKPALPPFRQSTRTRNLPAHLRDYYLN